MTLVVKQMKRKVKTLTGDEITRQATLKYNIPESDEDVKALYGEHLANWAAYGYASYARLIATMRLSGSVGDKKLVRQFRESVRTLVDVMEIAKDEAVALLLSKSQFAKLATVIAEMKAGSQVAVFDFTIDELPVPRSFEGDEEEEEEEEV